MKRSFALMFFCSLVSSMSLAGEPLSKIMDLISNRTKEVLNAKAWQKKVTVNGKSDAFIYSGPVDCEVNAEFSNNPNTLTELNIGYLKSTQEPRLFCARTRLATMYFRDGSCTIMSNTSALTKIHCAFIVDDEVNDYSGEVEPPFDSWNELEITPNYIKINDIKCAF